MAMLVLVFDANSSEAGIDAEAATALASLGVTHVAMATDETTEAVVLDGWAFDAEASADEVRGIVCGPPATKTLRSVVQMILTQDRQLENIRGLESPLTQKGSK
ncbi:MAG TPA: hypothetical protein VFH56_09720 [Acidimicrobiales bacterium]|nr:hypothetical protein [Acidimicrobiales bacterium]